MYICLLLLLQRRRRHCRCRSRHHVVLLYYALQSHTCHAFYACIYMCMYFASIAIKPKFLPLRKVRIEFLHYIHFNVALKFFGVFTLNFTTGASVSKVKHFAFS